MAIDGTAPIRFERGARDIMELFDEPVDVIVSPVVERCRPREFRRRRFHRSALRKGPLFDRAPPVRLQLIQTFLQDLRVEAGDREGADAAASAAQPAGELAQ